MGMSTRVSGVRDLDGQFAKMIAAKHACETAEVGYPVEVKEYFSAGDYEVECDEDTLRQAMEAVNIDNATKEIGDADSSGYEIDVKKLPNEVKAVRVLNSW